MAAPNRPDADEHELRSYLALLAGHAPSEHFLEIRYRVREDQLAHEFHGVGDVDALVNGIRSRGSRTDVYVGCAPRTRRSGTKDAVSEVWTLWAECDGRESANLVLGFRPQPSVIIGSGSGSNCHAYWPLTKPLTPAKAEVLNLRLAHAVKADLACFDAARILRPPGTFNFKHVPARPVGVLRLHSELRFSVAAVARNLPTVREDVVERRWSMPPRGTTGDPLLEIPPREYITDLVGVRPGRTGKVRCPFHQDVRPSLHAYPTGARGWCCFSCRRGGTIYDLAAGVWGLETRGRDFVELRRRLTDMYARELGVARDLDLGGRR
ncbi:hypothetical protein OJ998_04975 [Solirubrobacter taibaiensis]|nr:hypothetical protein [Solirubrobacter taibaiensis]